MNDNSISETKENKRTLYISFRKLCIPIVAVSAFSSIILFIVLMLISGVRIINILFTMTERTVDSYMESEYSSRVIDQSLYDYYIYAANFIQYYQEVTGAEDSELPDLAEKWFEDCYGIILSPEGNVLYKSSGLQIETDHIVISDDQDSDDVVSEFTGTETVFAKKLSSGNYVGTVLTFIDETNYTYDAGRFNSPLTVAPPVTGSFKASDYPIILFVRYQKDGFIECAGHLYMADEVKNITFNEITKTTVRNRVFGVSVVRWNGTHYLAVHGPFENGDLELYTCALPFEEIIMPVLEINLLVSLIFALMVFMVISYIFYLRQYKVMKIDNNEAYSESGVRRKERIVPVIGIVVIMTAAYFSQTLLWLSNYVLDDPEELAEIRENYKEYNQSLANIRDRQIMMRVDYARVLSQFIGENNESVDRLMLNRLSEIFDLDYIILYDAEGNEILSDSTYINLSVPTSESDPDHVFRSLLKGEPYVIQDTVINTYTKNPNRKIGTSVYGNDGSLIGILVLSYDEYSIYENFGETFIPTFLNSVKNNDISVYAAVNTEDYRLSAFPDKNAVGGDARDIGFTERMFEPGFSGKVNLNGEKYYVSGTTIDNHYVYVLTKPVHVYAMRAPYTIFTGVLFLLAILFMKWYLREKRSGYDRVYCGTEEVETFLTLYAEENNYASESENDSAEIRLLRNYKELGEEWILKTPESKTYRMLEVLSTVIALVLAIYFVFSMHYNSQSLMIKIINSRWAKGLNVFAATYCLITILFGFVIVNVIRWVLRLLSQISGPRGKTICRLLESTTEYVSAIIVFYLCLVNLGTNIQSLVASLGLLTIIIGMGARDIITDIIAGLFIIFEGDLHVGDVVEVSGYRGMITEIGLRTTKISGWDKNVKIVNNRTVTNVINMTAYSSFAIVDFTVPLNAPIQKMKELMEKEFSTYKEKYPYLINTPFFKGINKMSGGKVECRVMAEVPELRRGDLERSLALDIKTLLEKNGISLS